MADFSLTSKGETPVDSHSDENTSTTTRLKAVANGSISEARFLRELQRVRDEKTAAEDVFHKTLTQYETKIQHLEMAIKQMSDACSAATTDVFPQRSCGSPRTTKEVPTSSERRAFISVASHFVANLVSGTSSRQATGNTRTPLVGGSDVPSGPATRDVAVTAHQDRRSKRYKNKTARHVSSFEKTNETPSSTAELFYDVSHKAGTSRYTTLRNRLPNISKPRSNGWPSTPLTGSSLCWRTFMPKKSPLTSTDNLSSSVWERSSSKKKLDTSWRDDKCDSKHLQNGILLSVRAALWTKTIENRLLVNESLYQEVLHRVSLLRNYLLRTSSRYRTRLERTLGYAFPELDSWLRTDTPPLQREPRCFFSGSVSNSGIPTVKPSAEECASCQTSTKLLLETRTSTDIGEENTRSDAECVCRRFWDAATISAFETISCDLHRILPRFGVPPIVVSEPDCSNQPTALAGFPKENDEAPRCVSGSSASSCAQFDELRVSGTNVAVPPSTETNNIALPQSAVPSASCTEPPPIFDAKQTELGIATTSDNIHSSSLGGDNALVVYSRLRLLLESFCLFRPDLGYVQGMGYIAAMFILHIPDDFKAFLCFSNLMCRQSLYAFYTFDLNVISLLFNAFDVLLREKMAAVAEAFAVSQIESGQFLIDWMYTIFTRCLPFDLVSSIWDQFIIEGDTVLFQTALALVRYFQPDDGAIDGEHLSALLSSLSRDHFSSLDANKFREIAASMTVSRKKLSRVIKALQADLAAAPTPSGTQHSATEVANGNAAGKCCSGCCKKAAAQVGPKGCRNSQRDALPANQRFSSAAPGDQETPSDVTSSVNHCDEPIVAVSRKKKEGSYRWSETLVKQLHRYLRTSSVISSLPASRGLQHHEDCCASVSSETRDKTTALSLAPHNHETQDAQHYCESDHDSVIVLHEDLSL